MRIVPITIHQHYCNGYRPNPIALLVWAAVWHVSILSAGGPAEVEPPAPFLLILGSQITGGI
jgi:hypothetical protein